MCDHGVSLSTGGPRRAPQGLRRGPHGRPRPRRVRRLLRPRDLRAPGPLRLRAPRAPGRLHPRRRPLPPRAPRRRARLQRAPRRRARRAMPGGVSYSSNVDLFRAPAASWRDTIQIAFGPERPDPAAGAHPSRLPRRGHRVGCARHRRGARPAGAPLRGAWARAHEAGGGFVPRG